MSFTPRVYQAKARVDAINYLKSGYKGPGLLVLPTGAGKSWIIADLIQHLGDPPTLVIQPSEELLTQNFKKYTGNELKGQASLYSASVDTKEIGNVTYATPGSIKNEASSFSHIELIIIDEAHLGTGELGMIDKFIKNLPQKVKVLGLTATPIKLKSYSNTAGYYAQLRMLIDLSPKFWKKIIHVTQVAEVYEGGYLSPLRFTTYNFGMRNADKKGSDFNLKSSSDTLMKNKAIPFAIKILKESLKRGKKKILVFTPTVDDAYKLQEAIPKIEVVSTKTKKKDRKEIIKKFVYGDLEIVANYGTLTTGFDAPDIDLILVLRATESYAVWYQMVGRGMRIAEGKELCDIIDFGGNYKTLGDPKDLVIENHPGLGWGMFVKKYLITNIPLGQRILKKNLDIRKKRITFGKNKGMMFKDIPTSYLEWVRDNFDLNTKWAKKHIYKELKILGIL